MLDTDTKRRIDTARDILVGKVPDPKSQVEQITIALIYKFMDDMDAESEELGGKRKFFAGEYARFGWSKLMQPGLGGHEMLNLYAEGIGKMPENPGIPPLFREIFKNAFLPYRDPETLKAFLKIIDEFRYDHSERLGDAFEYLLSVLGSQGDAGQFRTPRHIIDFIVAIVDPKKDETVLDPACGTAGFLISAWKYILKANTDTEGHSTLTPDERARLARNFTGYDISPDMVRLSLVNLYLHGFTDPHIHEYDTLTSLERWSEHADVILANPPFMSPKGGIKPHNRFGVQSKRSEVLFVDYMAEHLTPNGRAGIIVPEGIIFQSQSAYKQLRKLLVDDYLVAVVSLPAGVFNPYSGVKTSILILDKSLAKRADAIAFLKVDNDGYSLGAQRREISKNDLPQALAEIDDYLNKLRAGEAVEGFSPSLGLIVPKDKIAANGDYNLSGERYRENGRVARAKWPLVPLGEFCTFTTGGTPTSTVKEYYEGGSVPWLVSGDIHQGEVHDCERRITEKGVEHSNARHLRQNSVLIALNGQGKTRGTVAMLRMSNATCNQSLVAISPAEPVRAIPEYIFAVLRSMYQDIRALTGDEQRSGLSITILKTIEVPLPPLDVQKEIVAEIDGYQKVIDGARVVLDNYRPHIPIDPSWPMIPISDACTINPRKSELGELDGDTVVSFVPMADIAEHEMYFVPHETRRLRDVAGSYTYFRDGDVLLAKVTPCFENGKAGIARRLKNGIGFGSSEFYVLRPAEQAAAEWVFLSIATPAFRLWATHQMTGTGGLQRVPRSVLASYRIPLPPLAAQMSIVAEIEAEQALVNANRELVARMEKKIQATLARVWGDEAAPADEV